jgi:hypothetical protein
MHVTATIKKGRYRKSIRTGFEEKRRVGDRLPLADRTSARRVEALTLPENESASAALGGNLHEPASLGVKTLP